jgi:tRNA-splicing ligase RtcB
MDVAATLRAEGIVVRAGKRELLAEEASTAYKDVEAVIGVAARAGHVLPVARLRPLAVVKG